MTDTLLYEQTGPPVVVGITTYGRDENRRFYLPAAYVDAVRAAGGIPMLLPPDEPHIDEVLNLLDGVIFAGGGDIDPVHYGASPHQTIYSIDAERDSFELRLARRMMDDNTPVLGICRGAQVLAVAGGGNLVQHVPETFGSMVDHRISQEQHTRHPVSIDPQSRLAQMLHQASMTVPSWHHQAVQALPAGWQAVAYANDGVIEAMEHSQHPWMVAVQWHPELDPDNPPNRRLFASLIAAAHQRKAARSLQK